MGSLLFRRQDALIATLVLVTHAPDLALRADRIVRMLDGRVVTEETSAVGHDAALLDA